MEIRSGIFSLAARTMHLLGTFILFGVSLSLPRDSQGLYLTLSSTISFVLLLELGVSSAMAQYIANELSKSKIGNNIAKNSNLGNSALDLCRFTLLWYAAVALAVLILFLVAVRYYVGLHYPEELVGGSSKFMLLGVAAAAYTFSLGAKSVLIGMHKINYVNKVTSVALILATFFSAVALVLGQVYLAVATWISIPAVFLIGAARNYVPSYSKIEMMNVGRLFSGCWLIYGSRLKSLWWTSLFTLAVFQSFPVLAYAIQGRNGNIEAMFAYNIYTSCFALGCSWAAGAVVTLADLNAAKDRLRLQETIFHVSIRSCAVSLVSGICCVIVILLLGSRWPRLSDRIPTIAPIIVMIMTASVLQFTNAQTIGVRSLGRESFRGALVVTAITSIALTLLVGDKFGVLGQVSAFAAALLLVLAPLTLKIYLFELKSV